MNADLIGVHRDQVGSLLLLNLSIIRSPAGNVLSARAISHSKCFLPDLDRTPIRSAFIGVIRGPGLTGLRR
jgi:hypothetical protein